MRVVVCVEPRRWVGRGVERREGEFGVGEEDGERGEEGAGDEEDDVQRQGEGAEGCDGEFGGCGGWATGEEMGSCCEHFGGSCRRPCR